MHINYAKDHRQSRWSSRAGHHFLLGNSIGQRYVVHVERQCDRFKFVHIKARRRVKIRTYTSPIVRRYCFLSGRGCNLEHFPRCSSLYNPWMNPRNTSAYGNKRSTLTIHLLEEYGDVSVRKQCSISLPWVRPELQNTIHCRQVGGVSNYSCLVHYAQDLTKIDVTAIVQRRAGGSDCAYNRRPASNHGSTEQKNHAVQNISFSHMYVTNFTINAASILHHDVCIGSIHFM